MAVVTDPVVVAAVCGFWEARGLAPMTIKLRVQHMTQCTTFVGTRYCPTVPTVAVSPTIKEEQQDWFRRLSAKALADAQRQPKKLYNVDLWEAWEFATRDYVAFLVEFQVCGKVVDNQTP